MRAMCLVLALIWCASLGAYVLSTEVPQKYQSGIEEINVRTGFTVDTSPELHTLGATGVFGVTSVVLFLVLMHSVTKATELKRRARLDAAQMRALRMLVRFFIGAFHDAKEEAEGAAPPSDLSQILDGLETDLAEHETTVERVTEEQRQAELQFATKLARLKPRFADVLRRSTVLVEKSGALSEELQGLENDSYNLETSVSQAQRGVEQYDLDEQEETISELEKRVASLEAIKPRVLTMRNYLSGLKTRFEAADGDEEDHLTSIVDDVFDKVLVDLENALEELEKSLEDRDLSDIDGLLSETEARVRKVEELKPKVMVLDEALKALQKRFDDADGDEESTLSDILDALMDDDLDELKSSLDNFEEEDFDDKIAELELALAKVRRRIESAERLKQEVSAKETELKELQQTVGVGADNGEE